MKPELEPAWNYIMDAYLDTGDLQNDFHPYNHILGRNTSASAMLIEDLETRQMLSTIGIMLNEEQED